MKHRSCHTCGDPTRPLVDTRSHPRLLPARRSRHLEGGRVITIRCGTVAETIRPRDADAPSAPLRSPVSDLQGSVVGPDRIDVPGRSEGDMSGHRPERRGSDSEGYGACTGCGDLWPCAGYRGTA